MATVDATVQRVLDSRTFAHVPRLRSLLRALCTGEEQGTTPGEERQTRVDLDRLTSRLARYYREEGDSDPVRVRLDGLRLMLVPCDARPHVPQVLAIVPFDSPVPEWRSLAAGFTEELIRCLARVSPLRVIARNSIFHVKSKVRASQQIAMHLGASVVLEGSLAVQEERLRLALQLIDSHSGWLIWDEEYDRPLAESLAVRGEVLGSILDALRVPVKAEVLDTGSTNVSAYLDCLRGLQALGERNPASLELSRQYFQSAIDQDPAYALAWTCRAECDVIRVVNDLDSARAVAPHVRAAVDRALEISPDLGDALTVRAALACVHDWNWAAASAALERAIQVEPGGHLAPEVDALLCLLPQGRWGEAFAAMERARRLDPVSPALTRDLGIVHFLHRDFDNALAEFRKVRDMPGVEYWLARLFIELRRYQEALDLVEPASAQSHRATSTVAYCYARMGRKGQAEQVLRQLRDVSRRTRVSPLDYAHPLLALGRHDEAFAYLRQALAERSPNLIYVKVDPVYDAVRSDPRLNTILAELHLAD